MVAHGVAQKLFTDEDYEQNEKQWPNERCIATIIVTRLKVIRAIIRKRDAGQGIR